MWEQIDTLALDGHFEGLTWERLLSAAKETAEGLESLSPCLEPLRELQLTVHL